MELLGIFYSIANYIHTSFNYNLTNQNLDPSFSTHSSSPSSSNDNMKALSPAQESTREERIKTIFDKLYEHDAFKNLWEEVNGNLHEPIQLKPSPPEVETAFMRPTACPKPKPPGTKCHIPSRFPHSVQIYVGLERPETHIFRSIIFETCNVKSWPKHKKLHVQVKNGLDEDQFVRDREEIEWHALIMAKQIADKIDSEICKDIPAKQLEDFNYHLEIQQESHVEGVRKQYRKLAKNSPYCSPEVTPLVPRNL